MADHPLSLAASAAQTAERLNVADRLTKTAAARPYVIAIACPPRCSPKAARTQRGDAGHTYATITFAELEADVTRIADGLLKWGVPPGARLALLVRPGIEFVTLVFALLRAGMVAVLIDPGMGRRTLIQRLMEVEPDGFIGPPGVQGLRVLLRNRFPSAKWNVTVGRRLGWGGMTLDQLRIADFELRIGRHNPKSEIRNPKVPATLPDDPAAIIFTSGSTGPAKGVLYTQRMFDTQVSEIQSTYDIRPGGVDLSCFPLFALFNAAMGVTTVLPAMDFSRPAAADPRTLLASANDWQVTQAFASPAVWRKLGAHCAKTSERIESLRQIFSCGAPVPANVLRATLACAAADAQMHTPYGATECLPVATIEAAEVFSETAAKTDRGAGVCVGRKFDSIEWRVIRISDEPIADIDQADELPAGEIGELIVRGPQASPMYVTRVEENAASKIAEPNNEQGAGNGEKDRFQLIAPRSVLHAPFWHRIGDVGYLDDDGRFWYCGRNSQRVETADGPLYTECVEAMFNPCEGVARTALVGVGPRGRQTPVLVFEPTAEVQYCGGRPAPRRSYLQLVELLRGFGKQHETTRPIQHFLMRTPLPVDVRHNSKINREQLAVWATKRLPEAR